MGEEDPVVEKGNTVLTALGALLPSAVALFRLARLLFRKKK